jgi:hypothetical protein
MPSALPSTSDCCATCDSTTTVNIPGSAGAAGSSGTNGLDGMPAYTDLSEAFTLPAELGTATAEVESSEWMTIGQVVVIQAPAAGSFGTFMLVTATPDSTHVTLKNLKSTAGNAYMTNPAPGTVFPPGYLIVASGPQGSAGTNGTSGAPTTSHYILTIADAALPSATVLNGMGTGILGFNDGTNAVTLNTTVPVALGGTAATTAAAARASLGAAALGANSDITSLTGLSTALAVGYGGTGGTTATTARGFLSAAKSGANSDITSLTGLSTPLSIAQGGTSAATAAAARTALGITQPDRYMSALFAFPAAGASSAHAHGLTTTPTRIECYIQCTAPDVTTGMTTGDRIPSYCVWDAQAAAEKPCLHVWADTTNINVCRSSEAGNLVMHKISDGTTVATASTNFKYCLIAWLDS